MFNSESQETPLSPGKDPTLLETAAKLCLKQSWGRLYERLKMIFKRPRLITYSRGMCHPIVYFWTEAMGCYFSKSNNLRE